MNPATTTVRRNQFKWIRLLTLRSTITPVVQYLMLRELPRWTSAPNGSSFLRAQKTYVAIYQVASSFNWSSAMAIPNAFTEMGSPRTLAAHFRTSSTKTDPEKFNDMFNSINLRDQKAECNPESTVNRLVQTRLVNAEFSHPYNGERLKSSKNFKISMLWVLGRKSATSSMFSNEKKVNVKAYHMCAKGLFCFQVMTFVAPTGERKWEVKCESFSFIKRPTQSEKRLFRKKGSSEFIIQK